MTAATAATRAQTLVLTLMVDTGTITRGSTPTFDPNTGLLADVAGAVIHTGICRVRQPGGVNSEAERIFGEQQITATRYFVDFPHDVTGVRVDDVITISATDDADLLGRRFRVLSVPAVTFQLYKGFACEVIE